MGDDEGNLDRPRVLTVTVNPSLDTTAEIERVKVNAKLRTEASEHHPGGGGINVSRAMKVLGADSTALWTKGGRFGAYVDDLLDENQVNHAPVVIEGETKQSFAVIEKSTGNHYRFSEPGPALTPREQEKLIAEVRRFQPDWLVLSGGLSPRTPDELLGRIVAAGAAGHARIVIDSHGRPLRLALEAGDVLLVKPNLDELRQFVGRDVDTDVRSVDKAGREMISRTGIEMIVASMGEAGAVMVTADDADHIEAPGVEVESRIGAGDSMVAGVVTALVAGSTLRDAVRLGVAAGTAAVTTPATRLCRRDDVEAMRQLMTAA